MVVDPDEIQDPRKNWDYAAAEQDHSGAIKAALERYGIPVQSNEAQSLVTFTIDSRPATPKLLHEIWTIISQGVPGFYDGGGMMNRRPTSLSSKCASSRAFETRFLMSGSSKGGGAFDLNRKTIHRADGSVISEGSYSRIGASPKFSNVGERAAAGSSLCP